MAHAINPAPLDITIGVVAPFIPVIVNDDPKAHTDRPSILRRRVVRVPFVGDENEATGSADLTGFFTECEVYSVQALYHSSVPSGSVLTISSPGATTATGRILQKTGNTNTRWHPRSTADKAADGTGFTDGHQPILIERGSTVTCDLTMTGGVVGSPADIDLETGVALVFMLKVLEK